MADDSFFQVKVHNMYRKTIPGIVDIRFISWPQVMKKIISTPHNAFVQNVSYL